MKEETARFDGCSETNGQKQAAAYTTSEGKVRSHESAHQEWLEEMNERTERQQKAMAEPKICDLVNWDLTFKNRVAEREFFEESWDDSMAQATKLLIAALAVSVGNVVLYQAASDSKYLMVSQLVHVAQVGCGLLMSTSQSCLCLRSPNRWYGHGLLAFAFFLPLASFWAASGYWAHHGNSGWCSLDIYQGKIEVMCEATNIGELPLESYVNVFMGAFYCIICFSISYIAIAVALLFLNAVFIVLIGIGTGSGTFLLLIASIIVSLMAYTQELSCRRNFVSRQMLMREREKFDNATTHWCTVPQGRSTWGGTATEDPVKAQARPSIGFTSRAIRAQLKGNPPAAASLNTLPSLFDVQMLAFLLQTCVCTAPRRVSRRCGPPTTPCRTRCLHPVRCLRHPDHTRKPTQSRLTTKPSVSAAHLSMMLPVKKRSIAHHT